MNHPKALNNTGWAFICIMHRDIRKTLLIGVLFAISNVIWWRIDDKVSSQLPNNNNNWLETRKSSEINRGHNFGHWWSREVFVAAT